MRNKLIERDEQKLANYFLMLSLILLMRRIFINKKQIKKKLIQETGENGNNSLLKANPSQQSHLIKKLKMTHQKVVSLIQGNWMIISRITVNGLNL